MPSGPTTGGQPSADIAHERVTLELKGAMRMLDENLDLLGTHIHEAIRQDLMYKVAHSGNTGTDGAGSLVRCSLWQRNRSGGGARVGPVLQILRQTWKTIAMDTKRLLLAHARLVSGSTNSPSFLSSLGFGSRSPTSPKRSPALAPSYGPIEAEDVEPLSNDPLNQRQLHSLRYAMEILRDFFRSEGNGLQMHDLIDMPWIEQLVELYDLPTKTLVTKLFDADIANSEVHGNLVLSLLAARTNDKLAQQFLREHEEAERRRKKWQQL